MILTEQEIKESVGFTTDQMTAYRRIESAVLERLKAQEPVAHMVQHDGKCIGFLPTSEKNTVPVFTHPLPLADVVRDAERLDWLMNSGRIVICDRDGCYTYTHTSGRYGPVAKTQREAIDAAMEKMK